MKVLVVSHSCIIDRNRSKFIKLSQYPDVEIALLVPQYFRDDFSPIKKLGPQFDSFVKIYALPPFLGNIPNKSISLHFYLDWEKVISQFNPQIIHVEEEPWSLSAFQFAISKRRAKFLFFTEQNLFKRYPPPFSEFEQFVYRKSSCAIAVSETAKSVLINKGYNKKVFVIPHEVDTKGFCKIDSKLLRNSLNLNGFVIGYAGRLAKEKGIDTLLQAVDSLKLDDISLLLIGRGPLLKRVKATKVKSVILENIPHNEIYKYLNCMDVLVLPSLTTKNWKEQFGRVLIEAMACNVPVIGSSSGEIPNIIGDAGLVFREGDVDDLADKLRLLIENEKHCEELAEKGYERVGQNFSLEKVASRIYEVYKWVMANG